LPVNILDNDFRDPDVDRFLERFEEYDPSVAVLGDAYDVGEAEELDRIGRELKESYPYKELVVVPKCREAIEVVDEELVLGYAMGYSDVQAEDFSEPVDWRGRRVHLLGASPPKQYGTIQELTQPTLGGDQPADIVGLDWNGMQGVAYNGEYWSRDGWQPADHLSIRETVRESLKEIKTFWEETDVWPDTESINLYGPAVEEPDEPLYAVNGADIETREQLEKSIVEEYEGRKLAFQSEVEKAFLEYRGNLVTSGAVLGTSN
jgi:hypothetical protein